MRSGSQILYQHSFKTGAFKSLIQLNWRMSKSTIKLRPTQQYFYTEIVARLLKLICISFYESRIWVSALPKMLAKIILRQRYVGLQTSKRDAPFTFFIRRRLCVRPFTTRGFACYLSHYQRLHALPFTTLPEAPPTTILTTECSTYHLSPHCRRLRILPFYLRTNNLFFHVRFLFLCRGSTPIHSCVS